MLALLSEGPKYGLQLREEFEARTGEVWPLNVGQVYTTLQRLERDGLIVSDDAGDATDSPQKAYRITEPGSRELSAWLRTPPDLSSPPRDELVMKILVSLRVPGIDARDVIQAHRRYLVELMQQWTRIKDEATGAGDSGSAGGEDLSLHLAVDAEMFRLDGVMRWLDSAEARIRRMGAHGTPDGEPAADATGAGTTKAAGPTGTTNTPGTQASAPLPRLRRGMRTGR
jgi:DNA-binding PadR family transcriptional regulator